MEKSTKKWLVIGAIVIGALAGAWVIIKKLKSNKTDQEIADAAEATESGVIFPIQKGAGYSSEPERNAVLLIQRWLNLYINSWYGQPIAEDGKFGKSTESALQEITSVTEVNESLYNEMKTELSIA